jgi:hypothetical protein
MPLLGTRPVPSLLADAPLMQGFDTEPLQLRGVQVLQVMYEIRQEAIVSILPPALHPTIPPTLIFAIIAVPESPAGGFTLAEVRVGCRAGARPRGFVGRCFVTSQAAADLLRNRWGYPARVAEARLKRGYDRVTGSVTLDGHTILEASLLDPAPIGGGDIQYLPNVNMARVRRDGGELTRIVQVDPEFTIAKVDRGRPDLATFDAGAWGLEGAEPWWPVSASCATVDMELPRIRYVMDPEKPAMQGVEKVG